MYYYRSTWAFEALPRAVTSPKFKAYLVLPWWRSVKEGVHLRDHSRGRNNRWGIEEKSKDGQDKCPEKASECRRVCQRQGERATKRTGGVRLVREGSPKNGVMGGWERLSRACEGLDSHSCERWSDLSKKQGSRVAPWGWGRLETTFAVRITALGLENCVLWTWLAQFWWLMPAFPGPAQGLGTLSSGLCRSPDKRVLISLQLISVPRRQHTWIS